MLGPSMDLPKMQPKEWGVMPRALNQLISTLKRDKAVTDWSMAISYVEVYCEVIRDLLTVDKAARQDHATAWGGGKTVQGGVDIADINGVMHLKNLEPTEVKSFQDVAALIERAQSVRAQAATYMNDRSSRSHTVLTAWVTICRGKEAVHSKLNLVDLAGSERRKAVGTNDAKTSKEGDAINRSLLNLQTVVMALGQKGSVPAFRASKLTHFLKDSIGGNCKTTMVACAWGDPSKSSETLATCRFAERMMKVVVSAKKNAGGRGAIGNQVKLDPVVLALMEKRIAQEVAAERAKLMREFQNGMCGEDMSEEKELELEQLRQRVLELEKANDTVDMAKTLGRTGRLPPELQEEMTRMRAELENMEKMREELEAAKARAQALDEEHKHMLEKEDAAAAAAASAIKHTDEAVEAFMKLRELQPQHAELSSKKAKNGGSLDEEDAECYAFLTDEIQRLIEVLQENGFQLPELAVSSPDTSPLSLDEDEDEDDDDDSYDDQRPSAIEGLSSSGGVTSDRRGPGKSSPQTQNQSSQGTNSAFDQTPWLKGGAQLQPGLKSPSSGGSALPTVNNFARAGSQFSSMGLDSTGAPWPGDQTGQKSKKTGFLSGLKASFMGKKSGSGARARGGGLCKDALAEHDRLQAKAGPAQSHMVFLSPIDHDHVLDVLQDYSTVDENLPLDVDKMPKMPAA